MNARPWFLGTKASAPLAAALGAELTLVPDLTFDARWSQGTLLDEWRRRAGASGQVGSVVVAVWPDPAEPVPLVQLGAERWLATTETPLALWFAALTVAAAECTDGGQVVAVVDRPDPRESAGWGGPVAVAEAVEVTTRSLAQAHGPRGVRVNAVTTPARLTGWVDRAGDDGTDDDGTDDHRTGDDRAGDGLVAAVTMLLSAGSAGITANTLRLGGSR